MKNCHNKTQNSKITGKHKNSLERK